MNACMLAGIKYPSGSVFNVEAGFSWVWRAFNVETRFSCVCHAFIVERGLSCVCHAFNVEARRADL